MKFTIAHIFCGIGGKGLGAAAAIARFGNVEATFETIGGIDVDPLACRDFEMLVGAPTLCADVHALEPADLIRFFGARAPDVIMMSPPCKGFSGLLSAKRAAEPHYQRMNQLMERALFLVTQTWDPPPKLVFVENVPRIASRGKDTIARCVAIGRTAGYAVAQGTHDCGELGGLAQHRRRYFQLWRHIAQVSQFVYEPPKHRVRACGEVLGPLPMPGDVELAGPMHKVPNLSWRNWVRLALIPAGGDWRDLPGVLVDGEKRREKFRRSPVTPWGDAAETVTGPGGSAPGAVADPRFGNVDRVTPWEEPVGTITRSPAPSSGGGAVADPRFGLPPNDGRHWNKYSVADWRDPAATVTGTDTRVGSGAPSVADPRWGGGRMGVGPWDEPASTVTGESYPSNGASSVADPRIAMEAYRGVMGVTAWNDASATVTGNGRVHSGRFAVADPRFADGKKKNWQRVAGVTPWDEAAPTVTSGAKIHAGAFQVADPRVNCAPRPGAYRVLRWEDAAATITGSLAIDNGTAVFSHPANDAVITNVFPGPATAGAELGRFVLHDRVPGNGETWFLGRCFAKLRGRLRGVVSFSDPTPRTTIDGSTIFPGHIGTIYQAHNGRYLGRSKADTIRLLPDGSVFSNRAAGKIARGERGWRYAAAILERWGAAPLLEGDDALAWLRRWRPLLTRAQRHPGNHRYAWSLVDERPTYGPRRAYPKRLVIGGGGAA